MEEIGKFKLNGLEIPLEITDANCVFFHKQKGSDELQVIYQGSGLIVSLLRAEERLIEETGRCRPKALFDRAGNFHTNLSLKALEEYTPIGEKRRKHTALFEEKEEYRTRKFYIHIDDIFCLGSAAVDKSLQCPDDFKHPQSVI